VLRRVHASRHTIVRVQLGFGLRFDVGTPLEQRGHKDSTNSQSIHQGRKCSSCKLKERGHISSRGALSKELFAKLEMS
jgi:hypothetical protein